ncbi:MAG: polysaccharide biosynthesis tyrosine autokinase [Desulfobacterales bacterium]
MKSQEEEIHLLDYWRIISKRRAIVLTVFFAVVGIVAVYTFTETPIYMGTTKLLFNLEGQSLNFVEGGAFIQQRDPVEYINTQKEILKSRAFGDRVVRKLQLDKNPYFLGLKNKKKFNLSGFLNKKISGFLPEKTATVNPFPDFTFKQELDPGLTDTVLGSIELKTGRQSNIMEINFYADNPGVAAGMSNGVAGTFIEHNLDIQVKPYRDSAEWLSARLVESREKLSSTEKTLQQYREGEGVVSFETKENVITQQLQELTSQLVQTEAKRQEAEIKYNQIASVIDNPERLVFVPDVMNNLVIQGQRNEELNIKKQLSELSERFGPKHPQIIKAKSQLDSIQQNIIAEARKMLDANKTLLEIARNRETSLRRTMEAQKKEVFNLTRKAIDFNVIAGEAGSNKQFYDLLLKKLQEASLSSGISVSNVQIVDGAIVPKSPVKPNRKRNLLLALVIGLFGGIGAAFFTDYLDDTIKTAEDVYNKLDIPLLDVIPLTNVMKGAIFMASDQDSATAEAFRTIRTGLMLSSSVTQLKVILLTSAVPNEGKTTTAANLAVAMAQMGEKVLIIDGDMRRRNLHEVFGLGNTRGLSDVIVDPKNISGAILRSDKYPNLDILTGGTHAPNPSELLGSDRMKKLIALMRERYDRIILDSPPLLAFSDPLVLGSLSDGVILVIWGGKTSREIIQKSLQLLKGINTKILGVALNKIDTTKRSYYYYPYYSYYYSDRKGKGRVSKKA